MQSCFSQRCSFFDRAGTFDSVGAEAHEPEQSQHPTQRRWDSWKLCENLQQLRKAAPKKQLNALALNTAAAAPRNRLRLEPSFCPKSLQKKVTWGSHQTESL